MRAYLLNLSRAESSFRKSPESIQEAALLPPHQLADGSSPKTHRVNRQNTSLWHCDNAVVAV